jgi:ribose 1,5-bisphosphokinase
MTMANLFYVIGASGSGKDSIIHYARAHIPEQAEVVFTHRYITRPADAGGENHIALDEKEFRSREQMRCFAMSWRSHNTHYGIGIEINQWLAKGLNVVVNGSRAYLPTAARKYPEMVPVLIKVEPEILKSRLESRGREDKEKIKHRLLQARDLELSASHPRLIEIDNNNALYEAGEQFVSIIHNQKRDKCA